MHVLPSLVLAQSGGPGAWQMLLPAVMIGTLFYFLLLRPERRKQQDHKLLLESLKKDDRVVTIGGIYGVVANVRREDNRVTLKVDETNNTKLDVTFNAIAQIITGDTAGDKATKSL